MVQDLLVELALRGQTRPFGGRVLDTRQNSEQQTAVAHVTAVLKFICCQGGETVAEVLQFGQVKCFFGSLSVGDEIGDSVSC